MLTKARTGQRCRAPHPLQVMLAYLRRVAGIELYDWDVLHAELGLLPHAAPLEVILEKGLLDRERAERTARRLKGGGSPEPPRPPPQSSALLTDGVLAEYAAAERAKCAAAAAAAAEAAEAAAARDTAADLKAQAKQQRDRSRFTRPGGLDAKAEALIMEQREVSEAVRQRRRREAMEREQREREAAAAAAALQASSSPLSSPALDAAIGPPATPPSPEADPRRMSLHVDAEAARAQAQAAQRRASLTDESAARLPPRQYSLEFTGIDANLNDEAAAASAALGALDSSESQPPDPLALEGALIRLSKAAGKRSGSAQRKVSVSEW